MFFEKKKPMQKTRKGKRHGVALIAAIGVLATLFIMVGTVAVTSRILYENNKNDMIRIQLGLMIDGGVSKVRQVFHNQQVNEPTEMYFKFRDSDISVRIEPLSSDGDLYVKQGVVYRDDDVKAAITAYYPPGTAEYKAIKQYVINIKGQRKEAIPLSKMTLEKKQGEQ